MKEKFEEIEKYKNCTVIELGNIEDFYKLFDLIDDEESLKASVFKNIIKSQRYRLKKISNFMQEIDKLTYQGSQLT